MKVLSLAVGLVVCLTLLRADSLPSILARMDKVAPDFHGLTANIVMDTYQKILDSHTPESGTLRMQRTPKGEVRAIIEFKGADSARTIAFQGKIIRIYYPNLNTYQDVSLGADAAVVNQYLLLGFGSSGKELAQNYDITDEGSDTVAGQAAIKLLLVPKDSKVAQRLPKVEIWIPGDGANPIQQKFYDPSGNYRLVTYSDVQLNPPIPGALEFKLPKGAKKQS
jgi:outer membrane lipoprotein-sorting protein